jgi:hypothetical protein
MLEDFGAVPLRRLHRKKNLSVDSNSDLTEFFEHCHIVDRDFWVSNNVVAAETIFLAYR